jgi:hypothetical protein
MVPKVDGIENRTGSLPTYTDREHKVLEACWLVGSFVRTRLSFFLSFFLS